ncbi:MAG: zinc-binding dehydrogenase [Gammaproteobacteria bacterium]|nr:zinc-binding dehydrogenase [Gammaproteobacteria bacterium]
MLGRMPPSPKPDHTLRHAWRIAQAGSLARLKLIEEPLPPPGSGEVQVEVEAIGINFADVFACLGLYSATPKGSFVPGLECAGRIRRLGSRVTGWQEGDAVIVLTRFGGYTTHLNVDARTLWPIPAGWTFEEAAAYPVQALTAWYGLRPLGNARAGSAVLVQSAAGGVGLNALHALQRIGARPVAVVGSAGKRDWLIDHFGLDPATVVIRGPGLDTALDAALAHLAKPGFDVVLDAVYGEGFRLAFKRLAPEGRYVLYGAADFMDGGRRPNFLKLAWRYLRRPRLDPLAMISQNRGFLAFNLIWLWEQADRLPESMRATFALIVERPHIGAIYRFDEAHAALAAIQSGHTTGKLILSSKLQSKDG